MPVPLIVLSLKSTLLRALISSSVKATIWSEVKVSSTIDLIRPLSLLRFALAALFSESLSASSVWVAADPVFALGVGASTEDSEVETVASVVTGDVVAGEDDTAVLDALSSVIGELVLLDCVVVTVVSTSECVDEELTTSEVAVLVSVSLANAMDTVLFSVVVVATDDAVSVTWSAFTWLTPRNAKVPTSADVAPTVATLRIL